MMAGAGKPPPLWKLGLLLYPFTTAALAVNLFMLSLAWQRIGLAALPPTMALLISLPLSLPITWAAAKWVRRLMREAEPGVRLIMEDTRSTSDPDWHARPPQSGEDDQ